jgi:hypothetical protein
MLYLSKNERRKKTYYRYVRKLICETLSISDREFERHQPAWKKFLKILNEAEDSTDPCYPLEGSLSPISKLAMDINAKPLYRAMATAICLSPEKNPSLFSWSETEKGEKKRYLHGREGLYYFALGFLRTKEEDLRFFRLEKLLFERNIREAKSLDVREWRSPMLMSDYNASIRHALRILPEEDILAQKLFDLYSLDLEDENKPERRMNNHYNVDGYHSFVNFLMYEPMPVKWKYEMDKKMRSIILAEQKKGETEPCRALLAYAKHAEQIFSFFESQEKRLEETGMFSPAYAIHHLPLLPLLAGQIEFLLGFSSVEQKPYCVFPKKVPKLFRIFSGDEYKKIRYLIARHIVLLDRKHPWALWRELANGYADGIALAKLLLVECADDAELVTRIKREMIEANELHKSHLAETEKLKSKLQEAFDCLR